MFGGPGKASGLVLRIGQFFFSSVSGAAMASVNGFKLCTAFWENGAACKCKHNFFSSKPECKNDSDLTGSGKATSPSALPGTAKRSHRVIAVLLLLFINLCFLTGSMALLSLWSFSLAFLDIQALRLNRGPPSHQLVKFFAVGDWITSILSLGAATASAGVMLLFDLDTDLCDLDLALGCIMFKISIGLALISWFLLAITSHVMLWVLASFD